MHHIACLILGWDDAPGLRPDLRWAWLTLTLSAAVTVGYVLIAFNGYFQAKLRRRRESRAAMARLTGIVACCGAFGVWFFASDLSWRAWRAYDLVLAALAAYTWWFALRMRGLGLVDQRLAEADELERAVTRYRDIAELLPHVVWTATADGQVDFSNRRWAEFAEAGRTWLEALHPDESDDVHAWWGRVVRDRLPASREMRLAGRDGEFRTFVVSATPSSHGGAVKWLGACADVEDQKRLAAEKEAQARQKTFFLNALSHDLRAPLHNILLNGHLLKLSAKDPGDVESVEMIMENAVAAGDLVTKLLDFAKVGALDQNQADVVPLAGMLRQVARRFQPVAEQKGLSLRVVAEADLEVLTDRQKLERVLANLVDNAVKFTDRGGVVLELARSEGEPREQPGPGAARVRVRDTGIGVPAGAADYLFDEFFQVDNHERNRAKGFGMGLAICRSLARQLGGDVRLANTGPGGSCFELVLDGCGPRCDPRTEPHCEPEDGARRGGRPDGPQGGDRDPEAAGVCRV
jgi:PAS domain S-box-containing protein